MKVVIALGANLGDRELSFRRALEEIEHRVGTIIRASEWRETAPLTHPEAPKEEHQPSYLNGCVLCESSLAAEKILDELLEIERLLGRDRAAESRRWMSRVIDLDLITAETEVINLPRLKVPHPEMPRRRFVLEPLNDVAPAWCHPVLGLTANEMLDQLED